MHQTPLRVPRGAHSLGLALLVAAALGLAACSGAGAPPTSDPNAQASALANEYFTILQQPDPAKADRLEAFLAPEFQIVRANGDQLGRAAYLAAPATVKTFSLSDVVATQGGDVLVVSYRVSTEETIDGVSQTTTAPRLSVFRWVDGAWHLAAHSNFGVLPK